MESSLTDPATLIRAEDICKGWMKRLGTDDETDEDVFELSEGLAMGV
jgi:hypothetical protein